MKSADAKQAAFGVLSQIENLTYDPDKFRKFRKRGGGMETMGGVYYGSHYFNPGERQGNHPELQMTRSALRGLLHFGRDCFSVWTMTLSELASMVAKPTNALINWSFFSYVVIVPGVVMVYPQNRPEFGRMLAATVGTNATWSCQALREGTPQSAEQRRTRFDVE